MIESYSGKTKEVSQKEEAISTSIYTKDVESALDELSQEWNPDPTKPFPFGELTLKLTQYFYPQDEEGYAALPSTDDEHVRRLVTTILQSPQVLSRVLTLLALKQGKKGKEVPTFEDIAGKLEDSETTPSPEELVALVHKHTKNLKGVNRDEDGNVQNVTQDGENLGIAEYVRQRNFKSLYAPSDVDSGKESIDTFGMLRGSATLGFIRSSIEKVSSQVETAMQKSDLEDWQKFYVNEVLLPRLQVPDSDEVTLRGMSRYRNTLWVMHSYRLCSVKDQGEQEGYYRPRIALNVADNAGETFLKHAYAFFNNQGDEQTGDERFTPGLIQALEEIDALPLLNIKKRRNVIPALRRTRGKKLANVKREHADQVTLADIQWGELSIDDFVRGGVVEEKLKKLSSRTFDGKKREALRMLRLFQVASERLHGSNKEKSSLGQERIDAVRPFFLDARDTPAAPLEQQMASLDTFIRDADTFIKHVQKQRTELSQKLKNVNQAQSIVPSVYSAIVRMYEQLGSGTYATALITARDKAAAALEEKKRRQKEVAKEKKKQKSKNSKRPNTIRVDYRDALTETEDNTEKLSILEGAFMQRMSYVLRRVEDIRSALAEGKEAPRSGKGRELPDEIVIRHLRVLLHDYEVVTGSMRDVSESINDQKLALNYLVSTLDGGQLLDPKNEDIPELIAEIRSLT